MKTYKLGFNPYDNKATVKLFASNKHKRNKFLDSFDGSKYPLVCYNQNPKVKTSPMVHNGLGVALDKNTSDQSDVYFYINGVRKANEVKKFVACFIDLDAGRDSNGKYHKPSVVLVKKQKFLDQINNFPVKPSYVVDTRNGFQVYWILKSPLLNKTTWNGLQKKLANRFDSDVYTLKPNQIFRVPYTYWHKPWEGKQAYLASILPGFDQGTKVDADKLISALNGEHTVIRKPNSTKDSNDWANLYRNKTANRSYGRNSAIPLDLEFSIPLVATDLYYPPENLEDDNIHKVKLLKKTIEFLNQIAPNLYYSGNKFLSDSARELAKDISDKFCIG